MKKILLISYWFPPFQAIGSQRILGFAHHLRDLGWEVAILTVKDSDWAFDGIRTPSTADIQDLQVCRTNGFSLSASLRKLSGKRLQGGGNARGSSRQSIRPSIKQRIFSVYENILAYPDECWPWYWLGRREALSFTREFKPDILLSCALPGTAHRMTSFLSRKCDIPWVADYRDLWALNHDRQYKPNTREKLLAYEREILQTASAACTVSDGLKQQLQGVFEGPISKVMNGYDGSRRDGAIKKSNELSLVYTGTYYTGKQDITPLLDSLKTLKESFIACTCHVHFCGNNTSGIKELLPPLPAGIQFYFHGMLAHDAALRLQQEADVLIFLKYPGKGILTGKLFEYIKSGKKILALGEPEQEVDAILTDAGAYIAEKPEELSLHILRWIEDKSKNKRIENFPDAPLEKYSRKQQVEILDELLSKIVSASRR